MIGLGPEIFRKTPEKSSDIRVPGKKEIVSKLLEDFKFWRKLRNNRKYMKLLPHFFYLLKALNTLTSKTASNQGY